MNWGNWKPEPMKSKSVLLPEGDYVVMIDKIEEGTRDNGYDYLRVLCKVTNNAECSVSLFVDDNGSATVLFDTFGIRRGNFNYSDWYGKTGLIHLAQVETTDKKDPNKKYTNMKATFIVDNNGYAKIFHGTRNTPQQASSYQARDARQQYQEQEQQEYPEYNENNQGFPPDDEIPM